MQTSHHRILPEATAWFCSSAIGLLLCIATGTSSAASPVSPQIGDSSFEVSDQMSYWLDLQGVASQQLDADPDRPTLGIVPPSEKDAAGLRRDTVYFLSYQVVSLGLLYMAPESVSNWTPEKKDSVNFTKWWNNVSDPQWDSDDWWINYALHPYWGAAYFVRARLRGYDSRESFWYSFALSSVYEFGVEAIFEEPSIQDIFVTPALGAVLGSAFMNIREDIYAKQLTESGITGWDRFLLGATDPLGWLNQQVDKLVGYDAQVSFSPFHGQFRAPKDVGMGWDSGQQTQSDQTVYGLQFTVRW